MPGLPRRHVLAGSGLAAMAALGGCSVIGGSSADDMADRGPVEIADLRWIEGRPEGYGEYEPRQDPTYSPDETMWLYTELSSISGEPVQPESGAGGDGSPNGTDESGGAEEPQEFEIDLHERLIVTAPDDEEVVDRAETFQRDLTAAQLDAFYVANEIVLLGTAQAGTYEATVTVEDRVSETSDEATTTFVVEG